MQLGQIQDEFISVSPGYLHHLNRNVILSTVCMACFFQKAQSGQVSVVDVTTGHAACQTPHKPRVVQE